MRIQDLMKLTIVAIAVTSVCSVAQAGPVAGLGRGLNMPRAEYINTSRSTLAPFAFVRFCRDNESDCKATGGASSVELTPKKRAELSSVNIAVNKAIRPVNDDARLGDVWEAEVGAGDCEDYALTKKRHLIAQGWPAAALRIAVAKTPSGEGHAVLVVKTSEGDLVLDNRTAAVRPWKRTDLTWLKIQSGDNPRLWFDI